MQQSNCICTSDGPVSSDGCSRSQTRKSDATDACGNTSTASRTISWIADLTPPTLTSGGTVANGANLGCNPTAGAIDGALGTATATDACSNPTLSTPVDVLYQVKVVQDLKQELSKQLMLVVILLLHQEL
jgi:hypothetical protein